MEIVERQTGIEDRARKAELEIDFKILRVRRKRER
jgi:hypothetical protein